MRTLGAELLRTHDRVRHLPTGRLGFLREGPDGWSVSLGGVPVAVTEADVAPVPLVWEHTSAAAPVRADHDVAREAQRARATWTRRPANRRC